MIIDLTSRLSTISEYYGRCKLKAVLRHAYTAIICVLVLQFFFMCVSNQSGNDEFEHLKSCANAVSLVEYFDQCLGAGQNIYF